jgi:hypothetical protein
VGLVFSVMFVLFLITVPVFVYIKKGTPYFINLEQWDDMSYELPIDSSKEALSYARFATESHPYNRGRITLIEKLNEENREDYSGKWIAWVKNNHDTWSLEISHGKYTECRYEVIKINLDQSGNYERKDLNSNSEISKKEFQFNYVETCRLGY